LSALKLLAQGKDFTITNLTAKTDSTSQISPFFKQSFLMFTLEDGVEEVLN